MKKIVIVSFMILLLAGCGKKQEAKTPVGSKQENFDKPKGLVRTAPMVSKEGVSVDNLRYDGKQITGTVQNRSDRTLDSLELRIDFVAESGNIEMRQTITPVPGGDGKTVGPGFAKKIVYDFPFEHWSEDWLAIKNNIVVCEFEQQ